MSESTLRAITILNLYPREMNIYGDHGNLLTLQRRCAWRGIAANVVPFEVGDPYPQDVDLILGGGGQDSAQSAVQNDFRRIRPSLAAAIAAGTPALVICGTYQLFGHSFKTATGELIQGLGIFDLTTEAGPTRLIGNIVTQSNEFGQIVGYENHSGKTYLGPTATPLSHVQTGAGNNGADKTEGIRLANALGTYLHGPLLPKNPRIADFLIAHALEHRYGALPTLDPLDDTLAAQAAATALTRPR
jgi:CobQ-like glutamine amidotransferase family enzyme